MARQCMILLTWISVILVLSVGAEESGDARVEEVLAKFVAAAGGEAAFKDLASKTCEGEVVTDLTSREDPEHSYHYLRAYADSPDKRYLHLIAKGSHKHYGYDGAAGWERDNDGVRESEEHLGTKLAWLFDPQYALRIRDFFGELTVVDSVNEQFAGYVALRPSDLPEAHYTLYFDKVTGLLSKIGNYWDIMDYREVDGVLLPHQFVASRKGGATTYTLTKIEHNHPLDDSLFVMPTTDKQ